MSRQMRWTILAILTLAALTACDSDADRDWCRGKFALAANRAESTAVAQAGFCAEYLGRQIRLRDSLNRSASR